MTQNVVQTSGVRSLCHILPSETFRIQIISIGASDRSHLPVDVFSSIQELNRDLFQFRKIEIVAGIVQQLLEIQYLVLKHAPEARIYLCCVDELDKSLSVSSIVEWQH